MAGISNKTGDNILSESELLYLAGQNKRKTMLRNLDA
jgi:hypothetical protein